MKTLQLSIMMLLCIVFSVTLLQNANASSTFFYTDKTTYVKGDNILIYGSVSNYIPKTPVTIQMLDNKNNSLLVSNTYPKPDASFIARIPTNNTEWKTGGPYDVKVQYGSVYIGYSTFVYYADQLSPLKQADAGTWFSNITCNSGLVVIMKQEDGTVACVKPTSLQKLISLNWGYDPSEKLTVYGLKSVYKAGQEIDIKFRIHTFGSACSYPQIIVRDSDQKIVWQSSPVAMSCATAPQVGEYESEGSLGNNTNAPGYPMGLLIINQPGTYSMNISWLDGNVTKEFAVISQTSKNVTSPASSIPRNTYPQNNTDTANIGNQTFYFTTLNDTLSSYHGVGAIPFTFSDVNFTLFPSVFSAGPPGSCGNTNFGSEVKFADGTYEKLGVHIPGPPCMENYTETVLSNHKNPQAGLEDYYGKIRLLVSEENQTSSVEPTTCDTPYNPKSGYQSPLYHNGTRISTGYTPVFYMPLNSTGKLCVHYNNWNQPTQVGIRIFEANDLTQDAKTITISGSHTVPLGNSSTVYTINSGNKAGFYGLSFVCGGMPFAVGYDNQSRIVSSDFPWLKETFMCPAITFNSDITGTSGIGIYYIAETTREQIGYNITGVSVSSTHPSSTSQNVTFTLNVRTYDTGAKLWFDFKDSNAIKFIGDPLLKEESNPCNWTFNNDRSVDNAQWLKLVGGFRVTDNPVTIPPYSNGTYTFFIFAKNLDYGWYGLSPIIFSESSNSNIPLQNLGGSSVASYYPITMGLDSNLDSSGVCNR